MMILKRNSDNRSGAIDRRRCRVGPRKLATRLAPCVACLLLCAACLMVCARPSSAEFWGEHILHTFTGPDGTGPTVPAVVNGVVYGATSAGGFRAGNCALTQGGGTVFALTPPAASAGAWSAAVLYAFTCGLDGQGATGTPVADPAGRLYGMTGPDVAGAPIHSGGTVYQLSPPAHRGGAWTHRVIYAFDPAADGTPVGTLLIDARGNLFGATSQSVFELTPPKAELGAWVKTVLQIFANGVNGSAPPGGSYPTGALVADGNGALYGTTQAGGGGAGGACYGGCGVVFRLSPPTRGSSGWTETVLYAFSGDNGYSPAGLVLGAGGVLYGTAAYVAFALAPPSGARTNWSLSIIANIQNINGGLARAPLGTPRTAPGTLYGSTTFGEPFAESVFSLMPPGVPGPWTLSYLHVFGNFDGLTGIGAAAPGMLLGVTANTVFALDQPVPPPPWHQSTVAVRPAGGDPSAPLSEDAHGVLYGTTPNGGLYARGGVYELARTGLGPGAWAQRLLYSFGMPADAQTPNGGVLPGAGGDVYGTTFANAGCRATVACGTVYQLALPKRIGPGPPALGWTKRVLYAFHGLADGGQPASSVIADSQGALYGTTSLGGVFHSPGCTSGCGTVFKLTPPARGGSVWTESVLHAFTGSDGSDPGGPLIADAAGALYGTTASGGAANFGTVFRLAPHPGATAVWTLTTLHAFSIGADGNPPNDRLVMDARGDIFGSSQQINSIGGDLNTACPPTGCGGVVFELAPAAGDAAWMFRVVYAFVVVADGSSPVPGSVAIDAHGALYATTLIGGAPGAFGSGSVIRLTPPHAPQTQWTEQDLDDFPAGGVGFPSSGLLVDRFGEVFGVTGFQQCATCSRIFELRPNP